MNSFFNAEYLLHTYGYIGVFVIVFLESGIIFALPGDSLLFTAGILSSVLGFNLLILILITFVATFLGGLAGYYIGIYLETLRRYSFLNRILKPEYIGKAHHFFERHGKAAVILSRFVPIMRTFVPIVAGVARMSRRAFIRYSLLSSFLWTTSFILAGYFLGQAFPNIKDYLSYMIILIVLVSLLPAVAEWLRRRLKRSDTK